MESDYFSKLAFFNTRMTMFVVPADRHAVVSFITGFETGTSSRRFTELLAALLEEKYQVKHDALGWENQIYRLAEQRKLEWLETYLLVSNEVIREFCQIEEHQE